MKFEHDGVEYDLIDPDHWTTLDAVKVQEASGLKIGEVVLDFRELAPLGLHAFVWVSLRHAGFDVAWNDLEVPYMATLRSITGNPAEAAPDPSTASTRKPSAKGGRARRTPSATK